MAGPIDDGFFDRKGPPKKGGPIDFSRYSQSPLSKPIPIVYGTAWVEGLPIYIDKTAAAWVPEWQDVAGVPTIKGYSQGVAALAQIAFCQGPITSIDYIRRDKIVYQAGANSGGRFQFKYLSAADDAGGAAFSYQPTFTTGDASTASLWAALSAETNPFRRLAYGHLATMRCERLAFPGGRLPSLWGRVRGKLANYVDPGILAESTAMGGAQTVYNALPGDVIKDILTSALWGVGLAAGSVVTDVGSDGSANSSFDRYCHARGWYIGLALTGQENAFDVVKMILAATDSTIAVSGSTWKVIPYGDSVVGPRAGYTYTPPSVSIGLTDDDLVQASPEDDPVELEQVDEKDTRNAYPISYVPGYGWGEDEAPAESMDTASVSTGKLRRADVRVLPCIRSGIHAQTISGLMAARSVYNRTTARFSVNWRHPEVEPGDFVSLTHEKLGFVAKAFRVLSTEEGADGATLVEAVEWNSGIALVAVYNPQTADGLWYSPLSGGDPAIWAAMEALAAAATSQATADGKIDSFWQASAPATASEGDLWFDTDDGNKVYRWTSGAWVAARDSGIATAIGAAATAQGTADGKARVYYQNDAPTGLTAGDQGDLWVDTNDNLKVWAWNGTAWVLAQDWYTANATANAAQAAIADMVADGKLTPAEKTALCDALAWIANADANHYSVVKAKLPTGAGTPRQDYEDAIAALNSFLVTFMAGIGLAHYLTTASQAQKDALYAWKLETTTIPGSNQAGGEALRYAFAWVYSAQAKVDAAAAVSPAVAMTALSAPSVTAVTGTPSATTFLRGDGAWATPGGGGTVTGVTGTAPITSSGGATPAIGISAATGSAAGSMSAADKAKLDAATTAGTASTLVLRDSSGQISAVDFISSSDARLKRDVRNLAGSLARVLKLRGKSYRFKGDKAKVRRVGLIAQEVREVVPGVVFEDERGMLSVSYGPLVAELIEAVRELAGRLDRLEGR